jgi:transposase
MPLCLIGMEACVGAHHLSRRLKALGHDARLKKPRCGSERRCEKTQARHRSIVRYLSHMPGLVSGWRP